MVKWIAAMALGVALMFTGSTNAADAAAKPLKGKVTAIAPDTDDKDVTDITIMSGKKKDTPGKEVVIKADKDTKVLKGEDEAKLTDIVVGSSITIVQGDGDKPKATKITIVEHKKKAATN